MLTSHMGKYARLLQVPSICNDILQVTWDNDEAADFIGDHSAY